MSTFVFAPSWVTYPNNPKTLKKETDEFPTLISHNNNKNKTEKKEHNVWLNPNSIQKIHHSGDEDEEEVHFEGNKYELERLKALVPKTKKSLSTTKHTKKTARINNNNHQHHRHHMKTLQKSLPIIVVNDYSIPTAAAVIKPSEPSPPLPKLSPSPPPPLPPTTATTTTTTTTTPPPPPPPKYHISVQEQQNFIYFIKSWTSTSITSHNNYSYFNNNISISSNYSNSSDSSDSSFQSDTTLYTSNSYFHHDPF